MKKRVFSILGLILALCLLCGGMLALTSCGDDDKDGSGSGNGDSPNVEGTYYYYEYGQLDKSTYIRLSGGKYVVNIDGDTLEGTYTVSGPALVLKYTVPNDEVGQVLAAQYGLTLGQTIDLTTATIGDGMLTMTTFMGSPVDNDVFYQEGKQPGANGGNNNAGNGGNNGGNNQSSAQAPSGYYYGESDETVLHLENGEWTAFEEGESISGVYEMSGNRITFYVEAYGERAELFSGTVEGNTIRIPGVDNYVRK